MKVLLLKSGKMTCSLFGFAHYSDLLIIRIWATIHCKRIDARRPIRESEFEGALELILHSATSTNIFDD